MKKKEEGATRQQERHGMDRKIMDQEEVYKRALGMSKNENNISHEASTKTTNKKTTKNRLPLPKTLYPSFTPIPIPKTYPTPTTITRQMKMPSNGEQ